MLFQEAYESLSTLKSLLHLHVEGLPQDFLHLTMPYLSMLPALTSLRFKPDLASFPYPAKIGTLPTSLVKLELSNLWVEALPHPFAPPAPARAQGQGQVQLQQHSSGLPSSSGGAGGAGAGGGGGSDAPRLSLVTLNGCHVSAGALVALAGGRGGGQGGVVGLKLRACTLTPNSVVATPEGRVVVDR